MRETSSHRVLERATSNMASADLSRSGRRAFSAACLAVAGIIVGAPTSSPSPTSLWYSPLQTVKATRTYSKNPTLRSSSRCVSPLSLLSSSLPSSLLNTTAQRRVQLEAAAVAQPLLPQTQHRLLQQVRPVSSTSMLPLEATCSSTPTTSMHQTALLLLSTSLR